MDWCISTGLQELVSPMKRDETENWMQWEMSEYLWSPQKYFMHKSLSDEVDHHQSSSSSVSCGDSVFFSDQTDHQLYQVDGVEDMDDICLSYMLEDLPVSGDDVLWTNTMLGSSQSIPRISHGLSSSKYLKTHDFSPTPAPEYWDKNDVSSSHFVQFNLELKDCPSTRKSDGISMEESVLQELGTVMNQMTAKTRLCYRDALYRLARNSKGSDILHIHDNAYALRSRTTETQESETNTIDRAIAKLMFDKLKLRSEQGPSDVQTPHFSCPFIIPAGDAEVPVFRPEL